MQANPLWPVVDRFPILERDLRTDVAIAGGGIAGLSCAIHLGEAGYKVVVVERDEVGSGATGASSGILYYGSGGNFVEAISRYGRRQASILWKETEKSIGQIVTSIEKNNIECGFRHTGAIMVAKTDDEIRRIDSEKRELATIGIQTEFYSGKDIERYFTGSKFLGGLSFEICCVIHPAQFAAGLGKLFNIPIFEHSPLVDFRENDHEVQVRTPRANITCGQLILATNLEPLSGLKKYFEQETTVVIASRETPETSKVWPRDKVIWTMEEKYDILYPLGRRLALELYQPKNVKQKLQWYFGGVQFEREYQWGDSWAKTKDLLPIIGPIGKNVYAAVAMGDEGVVMGFTAGTRMPLALKEKSDAILTITSPNRFISAAFH
jgi:gamma-glutamylputrescine oxidase